MRKRRWRKKKRQVPFKHKLMAGIAMVCLIFVAAYLRYEFAMGKAERRIDNRSEILDEVLR